MIVNSTIFLLLTFKIYLPEVHLDVNNISVELNLDLLSHWDDYRYDLHGHAWKNGELGNLIPKRHVEGNPGGNLASQNKEVQKMVGNLDILVENGTHIPGKLTYFFVFVFRPAFMINITYLSITNSLYCQLLITLTLT